MIAYVAKDLHSGARLAGNDDVQLPAFSTIKVLVAAAFWQAVAAGDLSERRAFAFQPWASVGGSGVLRGFRHAAKLGFGDLAHLMLAVSDNDATNIVASFVGLDRINELAADLGLRQTRMQRLMMDREAVAAGRDNLTSAADLAALLEELATGERLGPAVSGPIWASLEKQEHLDGVARYLPRDAVYAGKCGDDSPEWHYVHDCCLIRRGERRAIVVVMTQDGGGYESVSRMGRALFDVLARDDAVEGTRPPATPDSR